MATDYSGHTPDEPVQYPDRAETEALVRGLVDAGVRLVVDDQEPRDPAHRGFYATTPPPHVRPGTHPLGPDVVLAQATEAYDRMAARNRDYVREIEHLTKKLQAAEAKLGQITALLQERIQSAAQFGIPSQDTGLDASELQRILDQ